MFPQYEQPFTDSPVWSVSNLNHYIKELIDIDFRLQDLRVSGEISNFSQAKSGHVYFSLVDDQSQIRCVMWASAAKRSSYLPFDGDAVVVRGRVSVYETAGAYQLYVERIEPAGRGELAIAFERLKERLAEEGLFDPEHKIPVPEFPRKIGVVTSADAAALRDIRTVLERRWPLVSVLVAPTLVQGREAPSQIIQALRWLDGRRDIDTIIIARGGGSVEDLAAFNDEALARAIYMADHPVIVGVGHETDFTIADFVADLRAATPSAAAELAVPDVEEIFELIRGLRLTMASRMGSYLHNRGVYLGGFVRALKSLSPRSVVDSQRQHVDAISTRMDLAVSRYLERMTGNLERSFARLTALSPVSTLNRGYAIVKKLDGTIVRSAENVTDGEHLEVQVSDGAFGVEVQ